MSFVKCDLSNHYLFLLQLLQSTMHIYPQIRCNNFSKQRIQKQLYTLKKGKGSLPFWRAMIQCSFCNTIYFATDPICSQHHIFCNWPTSIKPIISTTLIIRMGLYYHFPNYLFWVFLREFLIKYYKVIYFSYISQIFVWTL